MGQHHERLAHGVGPCLPRETQLSEQTGAGGALPHAAGVCTHLPWLAARLLQGRTPGEPPAPFPFPSQGKPLLSLLGAVKSPEHLFPLLQCPCNAHLVGYCLPYLRNPPDLPGRVPFQPSPLLFCSQPSLMHTKITFLLWPGLCFPGQYIMPLSHSPRCPIWLPSYPHKDY